MPWLRLWVDILDDPDLDSLPNDTCWAWTRLLAVAKRNDPQGELPCLRRLATILREPFKVVELYLRQLIEAGLIDEHDGVLTMHGWTKWQPKEPMTNAERQARFRESKKVSSLDSPSKEKSNRGEEKSNVTTLLSVTNATDAPPPLRTPEDQKQFDEAISLLSRSLQTQPLSMDLNRRSDLSEVAAVQGWQWLVAARVVGEGKAKKLTFSYLLGIARNATRDEFEDYGRKPMSGKNGKTDYKSRPVEASPLPSRKPAGPAMTEEEARTRLFTYKGTKS